MKVLGVNLYDKGLTKAVEMVLGDQRVNNRKISATGAHGLVFAKKNQVFRKVLNSFYLNLPDGMPATWVGRLKGAGGMTRCYGPDFFKETMIASSGSNMTHFLCGGKESIAEKLRDVCEEEFRASIVGTYCPPFLNVDEFDYKSIAEKINRSKADIVWIGLSTPKQELFAYELARHTSVSYLCCVGAAFDFHIGNVRQAPIWIQKIGMEWIFRLLMEPKRLWKRYGEIVPLFILFNFIEWMSGTFSHDRG